MSQLVKDTAAVKAENRLAFTQKKKHGIEKQKGKVNVNAYSRYTHSNQNRLQRSSAGFGKSSVVLTENSFIMVKIPSAVPESAVSSRKTTAVRTAQTAVCIAGASSERLRIFVSYSSRSSCVLSASGIFTVMLSAPFTLIICGKIIRNAAKSECRGRRPQRPTKQTSIFSGG